MPQLFARRFASSSRFRRARLAVLSASAAAVMVLPGCAETIGGPANAAGVPQTAQEITPADRQQGAEAHPQLVAEFGGEMTGATANYVQNIGKNIALQSGLGDSRSDFNVTLLNSQINNAFAIPGGYVYVTRQLVGLMNNEAELAAVLGHEVAHVAARHSAKRQSQAQRNSIFGALGSILSGVLLGNNALGQLGQQLFSSGSQLLTLRYSRGQETEADNLGIQYLRQAGYNPKAMSTLLASLAAQNALDARLQGSNNALPEWASTHPDPASRVRAALNRAGPNAQGVINRDTFLAQVDGMIYGDDPKQGIVDGRTFTHPDFRLRFEAPQGFYLVNGTRSVSITGQSGKGELSTAPYSGDLNNYIGKIFGSLTPQGQQQIQPASIQRTTVNGIPAAYGTARVNTGSSQVDVVVFAYEFSNNQAFHFVTISRAGQASAFNQMFQSMRRITTAQAAEVKPRRIDVITARPGDTVRSLASQMAYPNMQLERFVVLNGIATNATIAPGQKVKIVVD